MQALKYTNDLMELGILSADRQAALVRTWGRSFARLADWQTNLLTTVALESGADPAETLAQMTEEVLPRVDALQSYVWRRHLVSAANRMLAVETPGSRVNHLAVRLRRHRRLHLPQPDALGAVSSWSGWSTSRARPSTWSSTAVPGSSRTSATRCCWSPTTSRPPPTSRCEMTRRGDDPDDRFPSVRAGIAYGPVVSRLGDVFGPTVNIAARLTSVARPGTVVIDRGAYEALSGRTDDDEDRPRAASDDDGRRTASGGCAGSRSRATHACTRGRIARPVLASEWSPVGWPAPTGRRAARW